MTRRVTHGHPPRTLPIQSAAAAGGCRSRRPRQRSAGACHSAAAGARPQAGGGGQASSERRCGCRVLDNGSQCREDVDRAVQQLHSIHAGPRHVHDVLDSIAACKAKVEAIQALRTGDAMGTFRKQQELSTAKRLGAHYLMRYLLLIAFRAFLQQWLQARTGGGQEAAAFSTWFKERKELGHLLRSSSV